MPTKHPNSFGAQGVLTRGDQTFQIYRLSALTEAGFAVDRLPFSIRVLLENLLRYEDGQTVMREDIEALAAWSPDKKSDKEIAYRPARVILQDFTGVPAVVDLAAMREALQELGGDPKKINPLQPADLVIDHSVQVDRFGTDDAFRFNTQKEFERNRERYTFLRWGQQAFDNFRVVPPGAGIVHQVNLEFLAGVVGQREINGVRVAFPDTLVGTDSHTTMINGLGVVGWGVGGIEAEAAMLGQPISMLIPEVVGLKLVGKLPAGVTATDLVLTVTQMLRAKGVVGKFVEFFGPGLASLGLADRATIANMAPEYGATIGFCPVDAETVRYLELTGRDPEQIALVEAYCKEQGLFHTDQTPDPQFTDTLELELGTVEASLAGPKRPQDRVLLKEAKSGFAKVLTQTFKKKEPQKSAPLSFSGEDFTLQDGSVVIAAITSCTNTSNPMVMVGAGLLAKKAVEKGLTVKPWVKTSLAPGSKVVADYLKKSGLLSSLESLKFHIVGFGCTTCIGNSGPLPEPIAQAIGENNLMAVSILSGNRNFEGRISPYCQANYLASPPLVVAYALAGRMDVDLVTEPLGTDRGGTPVFLRDIWPTSEEIQKVVGDAIDPEMFRHDYETVFSGDENWNALEIPSGDTFAWDKDSTYVRTPPFFAGMKREPAALQNIQRARVLALLGDTVTTDHISPAGAIPLESPTAEYLKTHGVEPKDFNTYGSRRGNHEVMMRGTFGNIRLRNQLAPGTEGGWTRHLPEGTTQFIYDAAMKYQEEGVPLIIIAGKEYGTGSSRDWAAKGTLLLGAKAVLAESFERIHRSNLIGMGVLPLQFVAGENARQLGLTGEEVYSITGIADSLAPRQEVTVTATGESGEKSFKAMVRIDTPDEVEYYRHGGILHYVLRQMVS